MPETVKNSEEGKSGQLPEEDNRKPTKVDAVQIINSALSILSAAGYEIRLSPLTKEGEEYLGIVIRGLTCDIGPGHLASARTSKTKSWEQSIKK